MKITLVSPYGTAEFVVADTIGVCGEEEESCFSFVGKMTAQAMELGRMFSKPVSFTVTATPTAKEIVDRLAGVTLPALLGGETPPCDCWEGKTMEDLYGMRPCEHERLLAKGTPVRFIGTCRCGAAGPLWDHSDDCHYPDKAGIS
jgi:hypothetical protein